MQKALGLLVLGTGLGFALYANAPSPSEREEQVAAITRIVARATILEPTTVAADQPGLRQPVLSPEPVPNVARLSPAPAGLGVTGQAPPQDAGPAPAAADPATPASPPETPAAIPAAIPEWQTAVAPVTVISPPSAAAPADSPKMQRALARQIQAELKRVGCYTGRLDGSWGEQSRGAMIAFIGRVNASLPTTEPDVILLSLVRNHTGQVCGMSCRPTEVASGGRCVPRTVLAATEAQPPAPRAAAARPALVREPLPGRMSMGGPTPAPAAAAPVTEWPSPAGERLPWQSEPAAAREAPADVAAIPSANDAEPAVSDAERAPGVYRPAAPRRAAKPPRPRAAKPPQKRRYYATRSVQMLFLHPLGRM